MKAGKQFAILILSLAVTVLACGAALAEDWPGFIGPNGNGAVTKANLARNWPSGGPKVLWTVDIGPGFGGPAIADGKVYLLDRISRKADVLRAYDLKIGKEEWSASYDAPGRVSHPGSRSTPFVSDGHVYTVGTFGQLYCFSIKSQKAVWNKDLIKDFGAKKGGWGFGQSPLVVDDLVIVSIQSGRNGLAAFNKLTGKVAWKSWPIGESDCYTSPMLTTICGVRQIVMFQKGVVAGVNPKTGKLLWQYAGYKGKRPIPNPVVMPDGKIFLTSGYGYGCAMIKVSKSGNKLAATEMFKDKRSGAKVPPAIYYDGHIYSNTEIGDSLQCMSAEGEVKWKTGRKLSLSLGSLIIADDLILVLGGSSGVLHLVEASPKGFNELDSAKLLGGREIWAPLALSNGLLVIRDQSQMKCVDVSKK
ncbi:MAG: PQQ-binding-like beta-propeller repeat protein [Phycisphaerae bacterium]|jgi:outer membrane protein assembly factor BamB|nr:PQQ-binding-like beta-propeller repeat protein [Phycisphaerae bacterium]